MFYFWYKCLILNITINRFSHLSPVIKLIPVFEIGNRISPAWFIWLKLKIDFRQYLSYGIAWENFVQYIINKCDNTNAKKKKKWKSLLAKPFEILMKYVCWNDFSINILFSNMKDSWCDVNCDVIVMWFLIVFRVEMVKWESLYSIIDVWVGP